MNLSTLSTAVGHVFSDRVLLQTALTHRSFGMPHNERLEFIGDGLLNCVIALALYRRYPALAEGDLSRLRASLVRQDALHRLAVSLKVGDFLRLGEGELKNGGSQRPSILADTVEALIGAVYLDGGFDAAQALIARLYLPLFDELNPGHVVMDAKTRDARLWTAAAAGQDIQQSPFALELEYARPIKGEKIADHSIEEMARIGDFAAERGARWRAARKQLFPDVAPGDRLTGVQRTRSEVLFFHNGLLRGTLDDAEFARLFFGIWLSPRTAAPGLRVQLLGMRASATP